MVTFDFYCPACDRPASASADPAGLLFAALGKAELFIKCTNCETTFKADVTHGEQGAQIGQLVRQGDDERE